MKFVHNRFDEVRSAIICCSRELIYHGQESAATGVVLFSLLSIPALPCFFPPFSFSLSSFLFLVPAFFSAPRIDSVSTSSKPGSDCWTAVKSINCEFPRGSQLEIVGKVQRHRSSLVSSLITNWKLERRILFHA